MDANVLCQTLQGYALSVGVPILRSCWYLFTMPGKHGREIMKPTLKDTAEAIVALVRGCTRPLLTFTGLFFWMTMWWNGIEPPAIVTGVVMGTLGWWFGERFVMKLKS